MTSARVCHLVRAGASTGVGGTLAISMAAFRAGVSRAERVELASGNDEDWCHAVRVRTLTVKAPGARAAALAASAIAQAWQPLAAALRGARIAAWSVGAPEVRRELARVLGPDGGAVSVGGSHASAALYALNEARRAIEEGRIDVALVAGAEVRSDESTLLSERDAGRVVGGTQPFGTVPGEAAAALVLVSEQRLASLGWPSRGRLLAVAHADEQVPHGGPTPCLGRALTDAIVSVLDRLGSERRVAHVSCDLNGERQRTDEWGFCVPRLAPRLQTPEAFITPVSAFGDVGAPTGLLLVALVSELCRSDEATPCLIWTTSRGRERAAALFETASNGGARAGDVSRSAPAWALELDASVLDELVEEAAFRDDQRQYLYTCAPEGDPSAVRAPLERVEQLLDQLVRGLVDCGPRAWDRAVAALAEPSPAAVYTAARVSLEAGHAERAAAVIREHASASPAHAEAARRALVHAAPSSPGIAGSVIATLVDDWLDGDDPVLVGLALELARQGDVRLGGAVLRARGEALLPAAERETRDWLAALARLDQPEARAGIERWMKSPVEALRRGWANAELALGGAEGCACVVERSQQDPAVVLPASIAVAAPAARALRELASSLSGADACLALGFLGDPLAIPRLLELLAVPSAARTAAIALEVLLGSAPLATRNEPDADESAPPRQVPCISLDVEAWRSLAERVLASHPAGARLRAGTRAGVASTLVLLERLHLPARVRRYLALELRVRWGARPSVDVDGLLRQHRRAVAEVQRWAEQAKPGEWGSSAQRVTI